MTHAEMIARKAQDIAEHERFEAIMRRIQAMPVRTQEQIAEMLTALRLEVLTPYLDWLTDNRNDWRREAIRLAAEVEQLQPQTSQTPFPSVKLPRFRGIMDP